MNPEQRFGTAYHLSSGSKKLFLKAESGVRLGGAALDSGGRKVDIAFDLFIPVPSPFLRALTMISSDLSMAPSWV